MLSDFNADEGHGGWGAEDLEDWWGGGGGWKVGGGGRLVASRVRMDSTQIGTPNSPSSATHSVH